MSTTMNHSKMFITGCLTVTWFDYITWEYVSLDLMHSHCDSASWHLCKLSEVLCPNERPASHCWCQTLNYHLFYSFKVSKYHDRFPLESLVCLLSKQTDRKQFCQAWFMSWKQRGKTPDHSCLCVNVYGKIQLIVFICSFNPR